MTRSCLALASPANLRSRVLARRGNLAIHRIGCFFYELDVFFLHIAVKLYCFDLLFEEKDDNVTDREVMMYYVVDTSLPAYPQHAGSNYPRRSLQVAQAII